MFAGTLFASSPALGACGDYDSGLALAGAASAVEPSQILEIIGGECVPVIYAQEVAGRPPEAADDYAVWAEGALKRILEMYYDEGFTAARAWWEQDDGVIRIGIDEGHIHRVTFEGANTIEKLTFADNVILMDGVLYEPSVQASIDDLKTTIGLIRASYRIREGDDYVPNPLGKVVPELVMVVQLVDVDDQGFGFGVGVESPWGPLVSGKYGSRAVFQEHDHLGTRLDIAFPIHEYAFEEEPQFRWVYGKAGIDYRFPSVGGGPVSPLVTARSSLSTFQRQDLDVESVMVNQNGLQAAAQIQASKIFRQTVGVRFEGANLIDIDMYPRATGPLGEQRSAVRLALVAESELAFDDGTLRSDLQDYISFSGVLAANSELEPLLRTMLETQWMIAVRRDDLLLRGRGIFYTGDVRFYHEEQLAGRYQKVFFGHRYWVEKAAQAEIAYRFRIRRNFKIGLWHDLSLFVDESEDAIALANGGGLGLHLLLLDQFAFDLHYGAGLSPVGFSHNMVINLQMVY